MFLKLLLTILVIGGALIYVRRRNQRALLQQPASPRSLPSEPQRSSLVKVAAVVSVVLMLLGAVGYLYFQWQDNYQVVDLRVVDTRSGNEKHYHAYKGDVEARGFVTTDGLRVSLAEVERMEVGSGR
ncbi:MAG: antitermination protein NusG [Candidatus Sedimenticola sp. (ex Thyasira tokunagai)]